MVTGTGKAKALIVGMLAVAMCVVLAACGGSSSGSAASSADSSNSESSSAADLEAKFIGTWKVAAVEVQGMTIVGDFGKSFETVGDMSLTVNQDGTGSIKMADESDDFTWELEGENFIVLAGENLAEGLTVEYKNDMLVFEMNDESFSGKAYFSKDGTFGALKPISAGEGTSVTSKDALVGTWNLAGVSMLGMTLYGDAESLSQLGVGTDLKLTFNEDGTATAFGEAATWEIGENGATVVSDPSDSATQMRILTVGDYLALDASEMMGAIGGDDMLMLFQK